jgi:hypothetical protein
VAAITWPAATVSASRLDRLPVLAINAATSGTVPAVEQARTVLETAYPGYDPPATLGEETADVNQQSGPGWPSASARSACCGWSAPRSACSSAWSRWRAPFRCW